jgi:ATP-dependent Clp protease, protease subunit
MEEDMNQRTPTVVQFLAPVLDVSINALLSAVTQEMGHGQRDFILLISTPGGSVFHGLSAYNYLKGLPIKLTTHNFGSIDSIGVVLYCAGTERYSVPQARFLLHGVAAQFPQAAQLEEPQLEERLKQLRSDIENISKVVSANVRKSVEEVVQAMIQRTTLNPEEAKAWGLVTDIRPQLVPPGAKVIQIQTTQQQTDVKLA